MDQLQVDLAAFLLPTLLLVLHLMLLLELFKPMELTESAMEVIFKTLEQLNSMVLPTPGQGLKQLDIYCELMVQARSPGYHLYPRDTLPQPMVYYIQLTLP